MDRETQADAPDWDPRAAAVLDDQIAAYAAAIFAPSTARTERAKARRCIAWLPVACALALPGA